jgi:REP element-mobilizing transposase RayT
MYSSSLEVKRLTQCEYNVEKCGYYVTQCMNERYFAYFGDGYAPAHHMEIELATV